MILLRLFSTNLSKTSKVDIVHALREEMINIFNLNLVGTSEEQELLQSEALLAIEFVIQPGFQNLIEFLESEYLPKTRPGNRFLFDRICE